MGYHPSCIESPFLDSERVAIDWESEPVDGADLFSHGNRENVLDVIR